MCEIQQIFNKAFDQLKKLTVTMNGKKKEYKIYYVDYQN